MSYGFSTGNGGAVSTEGIYAGIIRFLYIGLLQIFTAGGDGGFFFIDNQNMQMQYVETNWNDLFAYGKGGYIYGNNGIHFTFAVMCKLGNITSAVDPGNVGPDTGAAGSKIVGCVIPCSSGDIAESEFDSKLSKANSMYSMYKYNGKTVVSSGNLFKNCLGKSGSIFNLVNSELIDEGSTFEGNGAVRGGVAYCNNCNITFRKSNFTNNYAMYGGVVFIENAGILTLEDVIVTKSFATVSGGLIHAEGTIPPTTIPLPNG